MSIFDNHDIIFTLGGNVTKEEFDELKHTLLIYDITRQGHSVPLTIPFHVDYHHRNGNLIIEMPNGIFEISRIVEEWLRDHRISYDREDKVSLDMFSDDDAQNIPVPEPTILGYFCYPRYRASGNLDEPLPVWTVDDKEYEPNHA